ncbi:hypothetical protein G647_09080 [Cladophialophora carrionii CBS 160.54]|uniref:DUF427 domain-containing protein n=1 Tax=Cladophialophora carrionii CBS 160.54 TaxID=1279043 RepID=V9CYX4_9EURO|nr:uncharacterized protein G647_09080 [Cladophialophora carrionii CBS 160.54]ETI19248.1 hypothetical protein G647_09080 [Cladophialophora carrionii CBS 160.54]
MPTATARVNDKVIASTNDYQTVEGNIYFPPSSLDQSVLSPSNTHSTCPWKGKASYYNINANGTTLKDAAWYYPEPKEKAAHIKDHVAFYGSKVAVSVV